MSAADDSNSEIPHFMKEAEDSAQKAWNNDSDKDQAPIKHSFDILDEVRNIAQNRAKESTIQPIQDPVPSTDTAEQMQEAFDQAWQKNKLIPTKDELYGHTQTSPFKGVEDFAQEPLSSPEREYVRDHFQRLMKALPLLGFTDHELKFTTSNWYGRPHDLIGIPGVVNIAIREYRDKDKPTEQIKKTIVILHKQTDNRGKVTYEEIHVSNTGECYYDLTKWDNKNVNAQLSDMKEKDPQTAVIRSTRKVEDILRSINNPENSPEAIKRKLLAIRENLLGIFAQSGITYKTEPAVYHHVPNVISHLVELATGEKDKEEFFHYEKAAVYSVDNLAKMGGRWNVSLDTDLDNEIMRAKGTHTDEELAHGLGLKIWQDRSRFDYKYYKWEYDSSKFAIWANGDARSPCGTIDHFINFNYHPHIFNPHGVLIDFINLQSAITGQPMPFDIPKRRDLANKRIT